MIPAHTGFYAGEYLPPLSRVWAMELSTPLSWTELGPLACPVSAASAAVLGGRLYVFGGYSATGTTDTVQVYDPASRSWSLAPPLPAPRRKTACVVLRNLLYVLGGRGRRGSATCTVFVYDATTSEWSTSTPLPFAEENLYGVAFDGRLVVMPERGEPLVLGADGRWSTEILPPLPSLWGACTNLRAASLSLRPHP